MSVGVSSGAFVSRFACALVKLQEQAKRDVLCCYTHKELLDTMTNLGWQQGEEGGEDDSTSIRAFVKNVCETYEQNAVAFKRAVHEYEQKRATLYPDRALASYPEYDRVQKAYEQSKRLYCALAGTLAHTEAELERSSVQKK